MPMLPLTPDELLSTTRAVRKRLDLTRPVERELLEECLALAQQAPTGGNRQGWGFVVVTDPAKRMALADLYRRGWQAYRASPHGDVSRAPQHAQATLGRVLDSADYLAEHLHEVPVHVIPVIRGRTDSQSISGQAAVWGSILPAAWSFMLAARSRGLGTVWTTIHLAFEREASALLGIPFEHFMQAALIPVAHTIGTDFQPGSRMALDTIVHWDQW